MRADEPNAVDDSEGVADTEDISYVLHEAPFQEPAIRQREPLVLAPYDAPSACSGGVFVLPKAKGLRALEVRDSSSKTALSKSGMLILV